MEWQEKNVLSEAVLYFLMALFASGCLFYLHSHRPEIYVRFFAEDQWGEWGSFVYFALGGILLLVLSRIRRSSSGKYLWALAGLFALMIAAEEISWGQRILPLPIPPEFRQLNSQGELNLHNVGFLDDLNRSGMHRGAGILILGWSIGSSLVSLFAPRRAEKIEGFGIPLIPMQLLPLFFLVPFFFLGKPLVKYDEIGELFLGMAAAAWALYLLLKYGRDNGRQRKNAAGWILGFFGLGAALAFALTLAFPGSLEKRLNLAAARDYASRGMYEQSERLYEYIYAHPQYLMPQTRIDHGRMLIEQGKEERGFQVLAAALEHLSGPESGESYGDFLRRRGIIHSLLGQTAYAEEDFRQAIEIEGAQIESSAEPDRKAELLWSIARTLAVSGRPAEAIEAARQARDTAISERLRGKLNRWILSQEEDSLPGGRETL